MEPFSSMNSVMLWEVAAFFCEEGSLSSVVAQCHSFSLYTRISSLFTRIALVFLLISRQGVPVDGVIPGSSRRGADLRAFSVNSVFSTSHAFSAQFNVFNSSAFNSDNRSFIVSIQLRIQLLPEIVRSRLVSR